MIAEHWQEKGDGESDPVFQAIRAALLSDDCGAYRAPASRRLRGVARSTFRLRRAVGLSGFLRLCVGAAPGTACPHGAAYLNVSQFPLWVPQYFRWLRDRPDIRPVFLIHDLLPLIYPEFFPPPEQARFEGRLSVLADIAAGVIVTSESSRDALLERLPRIPGRPPPATLVAPLPTFSAVLAPADPALTALPYFLVVGTVEPRKNHLLLLNVWRQIAAELGDATPRLVIVGARGWDAENVTDLLERCPALQRRVLWAEGLTTPGLNRLLASARGLLMPSFAEGFGLPVAEALALGVTTIASDIPAFRALSDPRLQLVDPLDGLGWFRAIRDNIIKDYPTEKCISSTVPTDVALYFNHIEKFCADI
jgi:glycosyltransferase involved in cell wall biosynthesis